MGTTIALFAAFLLVQAQEEPTKVESDTPDAAQFLEAQGFTTLIHLLKKAEVYQTLTEAGPFTIFAPTNAAFSRMNPAILEELSADPAKLKQFLNYHILQESLPTSEITDGKEVVTLESSPLTFSVKDNLYRVNTATIYPQNLKVKNGLVQVVNILLFPPQERVSLESTTNTLIDVLTSKGATTMVDYIKKAGIAEDLTIGGPFTVFAPTNEAFASLDPKMQETLNDNPKQLQKILEYHILTQTLPSSEIVDGFSATTAEREPMIFRKEGETTKINKVAQLTDTGTKATNGIVYIVDKVMTPPSEQNEVIFNVYETAIMKGFGTLTSLLKTAGLDAELSSTDDFTLFAPTNYAFSNLNPKIMEELTNDPVKLKRTLQHHVIKGKVRSETFSDGMESTALDEASLRHNLGPLGNTVNGIRTFSTNIEATNGVIHVLEEVMLPDQSALPLTSRTETTKDVAAKNGLTSFLSHAEKAGLDNTLNNGGPFTIFVPTNEAFAAVEPVVMEQLTANPRLLKDVLEMHMLRYSLPSSDIVSGMAPASVRARPLSFTSSEGKITVNDANVITSDLPASNGLVYIIDAVILPRPDTADPPGTIYETVIFKGFGRLAEMIEKAGMKETLSGPESFTLFAPTNHAFTTLNPEITRELLENPEKLQKVIKAHIITGEKKSEQFKDGVTLTTMDEKSPVSVTVDHTGSRINNADLYKADIAATNGVIHVVNEVFIPDESVLPLNARVNTLDKVLQTEGFTTLLELVDRAKLRNRLSNGGPFTLLAPTNEAFAALDPVQFKELRENRAQIRNVLFNHMLPRTIRRSDVVDGMAPPSLLAEPILFSVNPEGIEVDGIKAAPSDKEASNGVIFSIDKVNFPVAEKSDPSGNLYEKLIFRRHNSMAQLIQKAGLVETLSGTEPQTLLVPTDFAFSQLHPSVMKEMYEDPQKLQRVVLHHLLPDKQTSDVILQGLDVKSRSDLPLKFAKEGDHLKVNGVDILRPDIEATNGVLHIIRKVLLPSQEAVPFTARENTVANVASANGLTTFLDYSQKADLMDDLEVGGPFTVFIPSNEAFAALDPSLQERLSKNPEDLRDLLSHHIVKGEMPLAELTASSAAVTGLSQALQFTAEEKGTKVNNALITNPDIKASNAIVHIIDAVIVPRLAEDNLPNIAEGAGLTSFLSALNKVNLVPYLESQETYTVFAPTNEAFTKLDPDTVNRLNSDNEYLKTVMMNHILSTRVLSKDLHPDQIITSSSGGNLIYSVDLETNPEHRTSMVDGTRIKYPDIETRKGIMHIVDKVLILHKENIVEFLSSDQRFSTLAKAVQTAGLTDTLKSGGPFTLLAPTDTAFEALPAEKLSSLLGDADALRTLLNRHVIPEKKLYTPYIKSADAFPTSEPNETVTFTVTRPLRYKAAGREGTTSLVDMDMTVRNGVIHAIDSLI